MGQLILVRHGQASFLEEDYDKLSTLGCSQSTRLGQYWALHNLTFDRIYAGPCIRQIDTAKAVINAYEAVGGMLPSLEIYSEFAEYPGDAILACGLKHLLPKDETLARLYAFLQSAQDNRERRATFQRLYERILARWVEGLLQEPGLETWVDFCGRVNAGLSRCVASATRSQRVAVFTSGGPIAIALNRALHLSPESTLQASFMGHNASWSEFLYSGSGRFNLSSFNNTPHLNFDPVLLTYR